MDQHCIPLFYCLKRIYFVFIWTELFQTIFIGLFKYCYCACISPVKKFSISSFTSRSWVVGRDAKVTRVPSLWGLDCLSHVWVCCWRTSAQRNSVARSHRREGSRWGSRHLGRGCTVRLALAWNCLCARQKGFGWMAEVGKWKVCGCWMSQQLIRSAWGSF